ncbi:MAG: hypothetical protein ABFR75_13925 [Acidobacteriota bacterium]
MYDFKKEGKFHYYCADLIDRFDYANIEEKLKITGSFPFKDAYVTKNRIRAAYIAGVVEELCRRDNLRIPEWVHDKKYFLKKPFFGGGIENLKSFLIVESPVGFRRRNIFVSENSIIRV